MFSLNIFIKLINVFEKHASIIKKSLNLILIIEENCENL